MQQTQRTIAVKDFTECQEEFEAKEAMYPGSLVRRYTNNQVMLHDDPGGPTEKCFAIENELCGKGIDDRYAIGDLVQVRYFNRGDVVLGILADGETAAIGSFLTADADGRLKVAGAVGSSEAAEEAYIVGMAEEALDLSKASSAESSGVDAAARLLVRIL